MKMSTAGVLGALLVFVGQAPETPSLVLVGSKPGVALAVSSEGHAARADVAPEDLTLVVRAYCVVCHNDGMLTGNLSLQDFEVENAPERGATAEKMIVKLRAGMMPPPGMPRPSPDTLLELVETLEDLMDRAAAEDPNPGSRTFQRLNRAEYEASIHDLLGFRVSAGDYLPLDTKSANFDNIADAQLMSPTLLDAYMRAAAEISRLAVGDTDASPSETQYLVPRWYSQLDKVEGAPVGTRGGTAAIHNFPADGEYFFRVAFHNETTGTLLGNGRNALHTHEGPEQLEISVDGERVALLDVDRWMSMEDPNGTTMRTGMIFVRAGPHQVAAAFVRRYEGPVADLITPHDWSIASTAIAGEYGVQAVPHLRDLVVAGPYNPTGVSETPTRQRIFTCRPTSPADAPACARNILSRLATRAFRRPLQEDQLDALMQFYREGEAEGGFEVGIRTGLEAILATPHFVFRIEESPTDASPGEIIPISDFDLASRLSYFLWGTPPDEELTTLAQQGRLSEPRTLEEQARRMLDDPRSEALATRFAAQWLRLPDLEDIHPNVRLYPDFHEQLRHAMRRETELFFHSLVKDDRSVLDLITADYTFVDERLAKHYGIPDVTGDEFRRVEYLDDRRRGIFGHASVLTLTSVAGRTSPVLRGKWVMEVILGTPPPPPPPGVPALEETAETVEGRVLTTRERMEQHRANAICASCHRFMDPIGLALDNFDVTGEWRIRENGMPLDTRGELYDGTPVTSPGDLRQALLRLRIPILRNFTSNLMTYALGRRVEYYDMPTVRRIVASAESQDYRMSEFVLGVVNSDAFITRKPAAVADSSGDDEQR